MGGRDQLRRVEAHAVVGAGQAAEIDSSINVPPRSLTPQRSASVAVSMPILTQEAWTLVMVLPSARRKTAVCLRFSSREISSTPWVRPSSVMNGMNDSGTNSVMPPVRSCSSRMTRHVLGQLPRLLDVAEHHRRGGAQPGAVGGLDDLDPARDRELVGADALADAIMEDFRGGARRRAEPGVAQLGEDLAAAAAREMSHMCAISIGE